MVRGANHRDATAIPDVLMVTFEAGCADGHAAKWAASVSNSSSSALTRRKWDAKNVQIVLECAVVRRESGVPRFLAAHFW